MKRNKFSLSHYNLATFDMGELVPVGMFEVLPGDTVQQSTSALIRTQPLLAPLMHPVDVRIHHWFVPYRLIWDDFEKFITGGPDGMDASVYPTRSQGGGGYAVGSLGDYLGIPTTAGTTVSSVLPFRAYALIWNNWYRDQDLQTALALQTTSGLDVVTSSTLQNVAWEKDYFTSSRPWEQKGPAITVPLGTQAPVKGIGIQTGAAAAVAQNNVWETGAGATTNYAAGWQNSTAGNFTVLKGQSTAVPGVGNVPQVFADLTGASAITVNALREALALQRFEEARARYGSRYVEYLRYLGVKSSDARLQLPEYLGGGRQKIQFSEVLQTGTDVAANTGVGNMRGHGLGAMRSNRYRRYFEEHGLVMSLASVKPKTMYVQGLKRMWNRRTREDFWQKELETIGQQEVLRKEVYLQAASPDAVFGYQDRYDEYRRSESGVTGEFRTTTLDFWHMARIFAAEPSLNSTFVSAVPTERNFPVPAQDVIYGMFNHSIQARRLLSKTGNSRTF